MNFVYGPVPSRRLGLSQGIDVVQPSTCTFDCIYCQLGRTLHKVDHWAGLEFPNADEILENLKPRVNENKDVQYVTISGSGEPTLNPHLGEIADDIRSITKIPLVLITNSSLLTYDYVLSNAKKFDIVMPSLDAGDNKTFKLINRPSTGFDIDEIADAIKKLKQESRGKVWLEVMLVKGKVTNATSDAIANIIKKIKQILPDTVYINSPNRPPAESYVEPLAEHEMNAIKNQIDDEITEGVDVELVPRHSLSRSKILSGNDMLDEILLLLRIRPCTIQDISNITGRNLSEIGKHIEGLLDAGKVTKRISNNETYYLSREERQNENRTKTDRNHPFAL